MDERQSGEGYEAIRALRTAMREATGVHKTSPIARVSAPDEVQNLVVGWES